MIETRRTTPGDLPFLEAMLFEAFFWDAASERPSLASFRQHPEFVTLLAGWGRPGDVAIVAESERVPVGATWFRRWTPERHSYGFVDASTPELGPAVARGFRRRGIGRSLLNELIDIASASGYPGLSLSVSPQNPARALYESVGFRRAGASGTSWTMRLPLAPGDC